MVPFHCFLILTTYKHINRLLLRWHDRAVSATHAARDTPPVLSGLSRPLNNRHNWLARMLARTTVWARRHNNRFNPSGGTAVFCIHSVSPAAWLTGAFNILTFPTRSDSRPRTMPMDRQSLELVRTGRRDRIASIQTGHLCRFRDRKVLRPALSYTRRSRWCPSLHSSDHLRTHHADTE